MEIRLSLIVIFLALLAVAYSKPQDYDGDLDSVDDFDDDDDYYNDVDPGDELDSSFDSIDTEDEDSDVADVYEGDPDASADVSDPDVATLDDGQSEIERSEDDNNFGVDSDDSDDEESSTETEESADSSEVVDVGTSEVDENSDQTPKVDGEEDDEPETGEDMITIDGDDNQDGLRYQGDDTDDSGSSDVAEPDTKQVLDNDYPSYDDPTLEASESKSFFLPLVGICLIISAAIFTFRYVQKQNRAKRYQNPEPFDNPIQFPEFKYDDQPI